MSEWKNYLNLGELTLDEFVKIVRGSKAKITYLIKSINFIPIKSLKNIPFNFR